MDEVSIPVKNPSGEPLAGAYFEIGLTIGDETTSITGVTDSTGNIVVSRKELQQAVHIVVYPTCGHWTTASDKIDHENGIVCERRDSSEVREWVQNFFHRPEDSSLESFPLRIGIIDYGFLLEDQSSKFIASDENGLPLDAERYRERTGHGAHVYQLLSSVLLGPDSDPELIESTEIHFVAMDALGEPDTGVLAEAIDTLSEKEVDLINVSAGVCPQHLLTEDQSDLKDTIELAVENGMIIVAASGNEPGKPVAVPASFDEVIAVGAVGKSGVAPPSSWAGILEANGQSLKSCDKSRDDPKDLFLSPMCCVGRELNVLAPGVGIEIQDRSGAVADYQGTSFSAPLVTGFLAMLVAFDDRFASAAGKDRLTRAKDLLDTRCLWVEPDNGMFRARLPQNDLEASH